MLLSLIGYGIIPVFTVLFAYNSDLFTSNFSVISQISNRRVALLIWGVLIGFYFYYLLKKILLTIPNNHNEKCLITISGLFLLAALYTPYAPDQYPFQAALHVLLACTAALLFVICLYMIILKLYYRKRVLYRPYTIALLAITAISIILIFSTGIISSALEIFFVISSSVFLRRLCQTAQLRDHGYHSRL